MSRTAFIDTIAEVTEEMRRFRSIQWVDPKKARGGPTLSVKGAMERLGFSSEKSIYHYANTALEKGGLPGYIPSKNGIGWIRKTQAVNGIEIMFYEADVKAWSETHPAKNAPATKPERVKYTNAERDYILDMCKIVALPDGAVYRTRLRTKLETIDYVKVHFPDGRPDATGWLIPGSQETATLYVARGDHRSIVIPAVDITILKPGKVAWNVRAYPKLKQILDDNGIAIPPLPHARRKEEDAS